MEVPGCPETGLGAGCRKAELGRGDRAAPASEQSSGPAPCALPQGGEKRRGGGRGGGEVRNLASPGLPTPQAALLCAMPHLTVIREPPGRMEAGHPEGGGNEEKGCTRTYMCPNILGKNSPGLHLPSSEFPESQEWPMGYCPSESLRSSTQWAKSPCLTCSSFSAFPWSKKKINVPSSLAQPFLANSSNLGGREGSGPRNTHWRRSICCKTADPPQQPCAQRLQRLPPCP